MDNQQTSSTRAYLHSSEKETFLQLDLCLSADDKEVAKDPQDQREIIFVVDCSGSMHGDSIREAKMALEVCLKAMQEGTTFNIYRFGSKFEHLFRAPKTYTEKTLEKGVAYVKNMDADLGGTEILAPLKDICSAGTRKEKRPKDVILLTDGEVGNEDQIIDLIRSNQDATRLFTVGIGAGCNEHFIKGVARAGRGASEFIYPGERIEPKMLRLFGKTASQGITDFSVDWAGMKAEQAPAAPTLFLGTPATLFAKLVGKPDLTRSIRVKGKIGGLEKIWEVDPVVAENQGLPVRLLWARDRIRDMEESDAGVDARGSRQKERKGDKVKETIIDLSKEYGLLSRFTSSVAIEERQEKDKVTGEAMLRKVPVLVTTGWHGRGSVFGGRGQIPSSRVMLSISPVAFDAPVAESHSLFRRRAADFSSVSLKPPWDTATESVKDDLDLVLLILSRQKAGGGIELDMEVSKALGIDLDEIKKTAELITGLPRVNRFLLLSTALLLSVLDLRFASERNTWESAVKKSRDWLKANLRSGEPKILEMPLSEWVRGLCRQKAMNAFLASELQF